MHENKIHCIIFLLGNYNFGLHIFHNKCVEFLQSALEFVKQDAIGIIIPICIGIVNTKAIGILIMTLKNSNTIIFHKFF